MSTDKVKNGENLKLAETEQLTPAQSRFYEEQSADKDAPKSAYLFTDNERVLGHETPLPSGVSFVKEEDFQKKLEKNNLASKPLSSTLKEFLSACSSSLPKPYFQEYINNADKMEKKGVFEDHPHEEFSRTKMGEYSRNGITKVSVFEDPETKRPIVSLFVSDAQLAKLIEKTEKMGIRDDTYQFHVDIRTPKDLAILQKWALEQSQLAMKKGNKEAAASLSYFYGILSKDKRLREISKDIALKDLPVYRGNLEKPNMPISYDPFQVQETYMKMKKGRD